MVLNETGPPYVKRDTLQRGFRIVGTITPDVREPGSGRGPGGETPTGGPRASGRVWTPERSVRLKEGDETFPRLTLSGRVGRLIG